MCEHSCCSFPTPKAKAQNSSLFSPFPPELTALAGADISLRSSPFGSSRLRAPPPLRSPVTRTRARPARALSLSSGPRDPPPLPPRGAPSRRRLLCTPPTPRGYPARQRRVLHFPFPLASRALRHGPSPGLLSPSLPPDSPSGRCHHVEASAATTDLSAPAAVRYATGRGPPASRGYQPPQRRPPGSPGLNLGPLRASYGRFSLPGACSRCREWAPPGSRGRLGTAAVTAAAATSGEARGSGHRQRQVRRHGFPGTGAEAAVWQRQLGSGPAAGT